ncbi:MAG TPA: PP2C family protein-serine/threonine phosphatase [Candidatus Polarisedimenticolia bacterium]|nr:PP2C family protein-serine/threonine phosphatase [Candidatus Polarisedimenticolia bacterium]
MSSILPAALSPAELRLHPAPPPGESAAATASPVAAPGAAMPYRFVLAWGFAWALVGCVVAGGIAFSRGVMAQMPVLLVTSVLFAEVVGFTALLSVRLIFPFFVRLPFAVRLGLQVLTLLSGTLSGSVAVLLTQPLFSLARPRMVAMIVLDNAILSVVVGFALYTYDSMRRQIEASYRALREREALERDLAIAREVQRELLPRAVPEVRGLQLAGACLPAVGVGGDLYDFLPLAEDRVGLVIADVSGKGIPAALLMAGLQASIRSLALPSLPPAELNRRLNGMLCRSTAAERYATLFFGFFDGRARTLTYSNAGHYPPLHLRDSGAVHLDAGGIPIGLLEEARYGEGRVDLKPGDLLALYTDGIIEAPGAGQEEFGERRLVEILMRRRGEDLTEIVRSVLDDLARWRGAVPQHDDVTLVLVRAT